MVCAYGLNNMVKVGLKGEANINDKGSEKVKCYDFTTVNMKQSKDHFSLLSHQSLSQASSHFLYPHTSRSLSHLFSLLIISICMCYKINQYLHILCMCCVCVFLSTWKILSHWDFIYNFKVLHNVLRTVMQPQRNYKNLVLFKAAL